MNKVRRLAEDLVNRYPAIFGADFDRNKEALAQVTIVRTRSLRNQLAGAITRIIHERGPAVAESEEKEEAEEAATIEERARIEGSQIPNIPKEDTQNSRNNENPSSGSSAPKDTQSQQEKTDQDKK